MYQLDKNCFCIVQINVENFSGMLKYLEEADSLLSDKIEKIDTKI
jgi:hypothetical protein